MLGYAMAVKSLADLVSKMDLLITDRKMRDAFLPLKEAAATVQIEHLKAERQHAEEKDRLKADHAQTVAKLSQEIADLKAADLAAESRHQNEMARLHAENSATVSDLAGELAKHRRLSSGDVMTFVETPRVQNGRFPVGR